MAEKEVNVWLIEKEGLKDERYKQFSRSLTRYAEVHHFKYDLPVTITGRKRASLQKSDVD